MRETSETQSWLSEKINNIDKYLAILTNTKREKTQITKIRNESGDIITDSTKIKRIIKEFNEQLYAKNWIT